MTNQEIFEMADKLKAAKDRRKELDPTGDCFYGDVNIGSNCNTNAFKQYLYRDLGLPVLKVTESNREAADDSTKHKCVVFCRVLKRRKYTNDIRKTCQFEI